MNGQTEWVPTDFMSLVMQEQTIQGGYCSYLEYDAALQAFATGLINPRDSLAVLDDFTQVPDIFEQLAKPDAKLQKAIIAINPM